jgi:NAD(P)-dependent dehydrogenase (short-subunit alcohol dehydrogenase family)
MAPNISSGEMLDLTIDQLSNFSNKVAFVTGDSSGVGLAFVKILASKNIRGILIADMNPPPEAEIQNIKSLVTFIKTDVTSWDSMQKAFITAVETYGTLDLVYANAGIGEIDHLFVAKELKGKIAGRTALQAPNYKCLDVK